MQMISDDIQQVTGFCLRDSDGNYENLQDNLSVLSSVY